MSKKTSTKSTALSDTPYLPGEVQAYNWPDKAKDFCRASSRDDGGHVVIRNRFAARRDAKPETREQWAAWLEYLSQLRVPTSFARKHGVMTVPAPWPWDFDLGAAEIEGRLHHLIDRYEADMSGGRVSDQQRAANREKLRETAPMLPLQDDQDFVL